MAGFDPEASVLISHWHSIQSLPAFNNFNMYQMEEDQNHLFLLLASTVVFALLWSLWSRAATA